MQLLTANRIEAIDCYPQMQYFVDEHSIVRVIWGKADTILFIFAGAAAEFALNKAVDWLYFTGRLPADPLGRLFSTVGYARMIVFSEEEKALAAIDKMNAIHSSLEVQRQQNIPDWAYRDVLFMLIDYSIRAFEALERKLSETEKEEVFNVFFRVGDRMGIPGLPQNHREWLDMRAGHLEQNLTRSRYTEDLFRQYRKHLGLVRYALLIQAQILVVPPIVNSMLQLGSKSFIQLIIPVYKLSRRIKADKLLKRLLLPAQYRQQINRLDIVS
ncbi:MAG TPA: oxygenase MpaB family protein [Sphingobacteriaceae bacterium]